jgi:hypothetical protein
LKYKFPKISDDKIKEGIFVGELIENVKFWIPAKWSGKSRMEIVKKCHCQFFGKS